jgi:hypothetical protein
MTGGLLWAFSKGINWISASMRTLVIVTDFTVNPAGFFMIGLFS